MPMPHIMLKEKVKLEGNGKVCRQVEASTVQQEYPVFFRRQ